MNDIKEYKRTEEEESQMGKSTAARFVKGKIRHDLIPENPIEELAKVYTYGSQKYDDDNWRKGMSWRKNVIGPLKRHLTKWIKGEKLDDESNCHHLAMVVWQCFCLMEYERCNVGQDDRNPYDLTLMNKDKRERRIKLWIKHARNNTLNKYNGLTLGEESIETAECPICGYLAVVIKEPGKDDRIECGNMYCPSRNEKPN